MSERADVKRQLILDKAAEVFASKGYRSVTMKDIVEASGISRGGLYLYYESTEQVFLDVVKSTDEAEEQNGKNMSESLKNAGSAELLLWFLKEQKKEILKGKNSLSVAMYEYAFECKLNGKNSGAKHRFETATQVLEKILERGNETGEFVCDDAKAIASNMMYAIEGMKVIARTVGISEKKVDKELVYMMRQFMGVEE
ncbi:MAG: TetR/AcrR family transcriptional regulator [Lachnospiraceae bacterium]|nr:TetR/AcrR family transcriptional regulator [Lachnospiraceae bacterium]